MSRYVLHLYYLILRDNSESLVLIQVLAHLYAALLTQEILDEYQTTADFSAVKNTGLLEEIRYAAAPFEVEHESSESNPRGQGPKYETRDIEPE